MSLVCRLCGAAVEVREDSRETRDAGEDPRQALRKHLATHPPEDLAGFVRRAGWILDMLAFLPDKASSYAAWRIEIARVVAWFLDEDVATGAPAVSRDRPVGSGG